MKATGMVRKIDDLGRVVIPMELRRTLGISDKDPIEIFVEGDRIILRKYAPGCIFCGSLNIKIMHSNKPICHSCSYQIVADNVAADNKTGGATNAH
jgi:AbrB family transcriptional regulator, transcriptional pleiotropic regulator of transition state genes